MSTIVNSWNEWDPLKHAIVGRADDCHIPPEEPALDAKVPEDSDMRGQWGRRPQETIDRANELLDNFANLLTNRGVKVDRPTPLDFSEPVTTPDFHTGSQFGCMPPRDVLLTVGKEILEATMSYRCRWFEYLCYRPLMQKYWEEDPNFKHEAAPKPRLTDADYHANYLSEKIGVQQRLEWAEQKHFVTTEEEPLFDAADVLRFGKDLVVQHGFTTNLVGSAGPDGYDDIIAPPSDRPLAAGDVLMLDTGCAWDGYFCDFDRNFAIGSVSQTVRDAHYRLDDAVEAALDVVRPGIAARDLFLAMDAVLRPDGIDLVEGDDVGRYGHGLGIQLTETPSHAAWDTTELAAGMVLTLEPSLIYTAADGGPRLMVVEENILLTDAGAELLTRRAPRELPVLD